MSKDVRQYNVKVDKPKKKIVWDELITTNKDLKDLINLIGTRVKVIIADKVDIVNNDKDLGEKLVEISRNVKFVSKEIKKLEELHKDPDTGDYFRGEVDSDNDKAVDLYINLIMGYGNLVVRIRKVIDMLEDLENALGIEHKTTDQTLGVSK